MPDSALQGTDPLADIDPQMRAPDPNAPTGTDPFADMNLPPLAPERTTGLGAFFSHAARGTLPSIGGFAAAAAGAEAGAAVGGAIDRLVGLKENVIIGRLIPAGTGFPGSKQFEMIEQMEAELQSQQPVEIPTTERSRDTVER